MLLFARVLSITIAMLGICFDMSWSLQRLCRLMQAVCSWLGFAHRAQTARVSWYSNVFFVISPVFAFTHLHAVIVFVCVCGRVLSVHLCCPSVRWSLLLHWLWAQTDLATVSLTLYLLHVYLVYVYLIVYFYVYFLSLDPKCLLVLELRMLRMFVDILLHLPHLQRVTCCHDSNESFHGEGFVFLSPKFSPRCLGDLFLGVRCLRDMIHIVMHIAPCFPALKVYPQGKRPRADMDDMT